MVEVRMHDNEEVRARIFDYGAKCYDNGFRLGFICGLCSGVGLTLSIVLIKTLAVTLSHKTK